MKLMTESEFVHHNIMKIKPQTYLMLKMMNGLSMVLNDDFTPLIGAY